MKNVIKVTENQAISIINAIVGSPFFGITQLTEPKLLKKDRDTKEPTSFIQGAITKLSELTTKVGSEYVTRVHNQLIRENKEKADYKQGVNTNPIEKIADNGILGVAVKSGKLMLEYGTVKNTIPNVTYFFNGDKIAKSDIGNILPSQGSFANQGTDVRIGIRKVYFSNIQNFSIDQIDYQIVR